MLCLTGADIVLPDRVLSRGTVVLEGGRIVEVREGTLPAAPGEVVRLDGHLVVPGFIDVHVHGLEGSDALDGPEAVGMIAARLPRHGVTAFCPTSVACPPPSLAAMLAAVHRARERPGERCARVLGAHLESNFINAQYRGAQPIGCLRQPPRLGAPPEGARRHRAEGAGSGTADDFTGADILAEIERARSEVSIVTVAPELDGGLELIAHLRHLGCRVSLGHSGATFEQSRAAIAAGASQATHLFNRMPPLGHREPGLAGAVLASEDLSAEIVCDGHHVHPSMVAVTVAAKGARRTLAITDGLAGAGLPAGSRVTLGGRPVTVHAAGAYLDDGTLAGSVVTMEQAFQVLIDRVGLGLVEAVQLSSTTPARELGRADLGRVAAGAAADLAVLGPDFAVVRTYIGGNLAFSTAPGWCQGGPGRGEPAEP